MTVTGTCTSVQGLLDGDMEDPGLGEIDALPVCVAVEACDMVAVRNCDEELLPVRLCVSVALCVSLGDIDWDRVAD